MILELQKAKEGIASSSGLKNLAPLLESSNVNVQRNATKILLALSGSPNLVPADPGWCCRASSKIIDQKRRVKR